MTSEKKVTQVTNETEYFAMLKRIRECSLLVANPLTSDGDKGRFLIAYDEMNRKLHYYTDTEYARSDPRLWKMFKELGIDFDETPIPAALPNWLED